MLTSRLLKTYQSAEFECIGNKMKIVNLGLHSLISHTHNTYLLKNNSLLFVFMVFVQQFFFKDFYFLDVILFNRINASF